MKKIIILVSALTITSLLASPTWAQCNDFVTNGQVDTAELLTVSDTVGPCTGTFCPGDVNGNGYVGDNDYQELLATLGPCPGGVFDVNNDGNVTIGDMLAVTNNLGVDCSLDIDGSGEIDIHDLYISRSSQDALGNPDAVAAADVDADGDIDAADGDAVRQLVGDGDNCRADVDDDGDVDMDDFDAVCAEAGFC